MIVSAVLLLAGVARAEPAGECPVALPDDPVCDVSGQELTPTEYLRALSLDLRGTLPTLEEYEAVIDAGEVSEATLDAYLNGSEFADRVVRLHRSILWNNLAQHRYFMNSGAKLTTTAAPDLALRTPAVTCVGERSDANPDGWVTVEPYWAPGTTVRACRKVSQERHYGVTGLRCSSDLGANDPSCGCGPNLRWCWPGTVKFGAVTGWQAYARDLVEQEVEIRVRKIIEGDLPYTEVVAGRTMYVNGPLAYFLRYQTHFGLGDTGGTAWLGQSPAPEEIPILDVGDTETWVPVALGPEHSGVLTSPAYLMRFTNGRGRAKRYHEGFLCDPFTLPEGGVSFGTSSSANLMTRPGCNYCHAELDPAAAAWGRWKPFGAGYLTPEAFPDFSPECEACSDTQPKNCSAECKANYVVDPVSHEQDPYVGMLAAFQFLPSLYDARVERGPSELVREDIADGDLAFCTAQTAAKHLLGRELDLYSTTAADRAWVEATAFDFQADGWNYKELVKAIVTSDEYRRPQ
jgi:hypothetical protein